MRFRIIRWQEARVYIKRPSLGISIRINDAKIPFGDTCRFVNSQFRTNTRICAIHYLFADTLMFPGKSKINLIAESDIEHFKRTPVKRFRKRISHRHASGSGFRVSLVLEIDRICHPFARFNQTV